MKEVVTEREQRKARASGADKEKQEEGDKRKRCDDRYTQEIQEREEDSDRKSTGRGK